MEPIQRQSLLIMIQGIEAQLLAIKGLLNVGEPTSHAPSFKQAQPQLMEYTSNEEDQQIEAALKVDENRELFMQDIFRDMNGLDGTDQQ